MATTEPGAGPIAERSEQPPEEPGAGPLAEPGDEPTIEPGGKPIEADRGEPLTEAGALAAAACHEPFRVAWTELEEELRHAAVDILRTGVAGHGELISSVGLDADPPADWLQRSDALLQYRRGVDDHLLQPLRNFFRKVRLATTVEGAATAVLEEGTKACADLASEVPSTWPEGALDRSPRDDIRRRFGKALARVVSAARKAGEERSLPLRAVASRHFDLVIVPLLEGLAIETLASWGRWSKQLEMAFAEWGSGALPALVRAEILDVDEESDEVWVEVREAAQTLQGTLESIAEQNPQAEPTNAARAHLDRARGSLESDLALGGSFLFRPTAPGPPPALSALNKQAEALSEWHDAVGARMHLYQALLGVLSGATAVQRRMVFRFRDQCLKGMPQLIEIAAGLDDLRANLTEPGAQDGVSGRVDMIDAEIGSALDHATSAIAEPEVVEAATGDIANATVDALLGMIRQTPAKLLLHALDSEVPKRGRPAETRALPLQELARQSFDALRMERIRSANAGLVEAMARVRADVSELRTVYSFARNEALGELEADEVGARDRADDLISGALRNIAEALRAQATQMDAALLGAQRELASEIADGSTALVDRVGAGRMEARLFAARSRATDLLALARERWGPPLVRAWKRVLVQVVRVWRLGAGILRRGSAIVGSAPPAASAARSLRALADPRAATADRPLVYQRLFTLHPISDPALLAGRETELEEATVQWKRWHDDDGVPLIVRGRPGQGVTSFLNVLGSRIESDGARVVHVVLRERITDEERLADLLSTSLELPPTKSLDQLSAAIFDSDPDALPSVVSLDNLEHLYLRVPGGTDLIERLLTLMSETEPRVFWIGGITFSAWQLVETAEPNATSQVEVLNLEPLGSRAMRAAVMLRHRRSGLAVRYPEPTSGRMLLRQRLRRRRKPELFQSMLEEDHFERLHRTSGGHLGLALFQWLSAADFETGDGVLMRSPQRPDFSVLDALSLTQNFTLKAFLEHRSLTLEEHDRIFRLPREESYQIFESLRNRQLLEPLSVEGGGPGRPLRDSRASPLPRASAAHRGCDRTPTGPQHRPLNRAESRLRASPFA